MKMQNAQVAYLETIEGLLEDGEIEKAIDALLALDKQTKAGLRNDIILQSGNFKEVQRDNQRGVISYDDYRRYSARAKFALLELMKEVPQRVKDDAQIHTLSAFQFEVPESGNLEKIIGKQSNLLRINWLEKALQASKAVCRIVCANEDMGTGFLTKEGYIFTNQHVIPSADIAKTTQAEFNYELDTAGKVRARTIYQLDASDYTASPSDQLDFARVRVIDRGDAPLSQWGFVEFDSENLPKSGDAVTIIQHPNGEDKQIALSANEVLSVWNQYVFYTTDTDLGSSGSPVFNQDWRVVAIHHAGKTDGGGLRINARGDRKPANQGILFRDIFGFLGKPDDSTPPVPLEKKQTEGNTQENITPAPKPPVTPTVPPARALSPVPKFVIVYDIDDSLKAQMLNKHLNVLKFTKKIRVYNVQEATGDDLLVAAETELADADYLLVLVTVNIFNSPQWFELVSTALAQGRRVIPILIEKADYDGTGLEKLRSLPSLGRAVSDFPNQDAAYADIVTELKKLVPK